MDTLLADLNLLLDSNPNKVYYYWSGHLYDDVNNLCRYDKMALLLLYKHRGKNVFRQCPLVQTKNNHGEPVLAASTDSLVRINNGERCHRVILEADRFANECTQTAGVYKFLSIGRGEVYFSNNPAKPERDMRDALKDLLDDTKNKDLAKYDRTLCIPKFYITCNDLDLKVIHPRKESSYYKKSHNLVPFDVDASDVPAVDAGAKRVGYDFSEVFGRGVIAGAKEDLLRWWEFNVPAQTKTLGHIKVKHNDIELKIEL